MPYYTAADGTLLHFDDDGHGEPVIIIAGGAARHPDYLGDLRFIGGNHRPVIPHLRGVGMSPLSGPSGSGSWWRQAQDIDNLRAHLGLERVTLVAHSAGTRVALAYAAEFSHYVERLVLLTPPASYLVDEPSDVSAMISRREGEPEFDQAIELSREIPDFCNDEALNHWQVTTAPIGYAKWGPEEQKHSRTGAWNGAAMTAFFAGQAPSDLVERLAHLRSPVLVVVGADDCLTGLAPVVALSQLFSAGEVAVIDECGHYPWVEQPAALERCVTEFLDRPIRCLG